MYLSTLLIDVGRDPDRPRPGRRWLGNLYRVHQRLCMAFPSAGRKEEDPDFLRPFRVEDFGDGQVHVQRKSATGFLFRVDPSPGGSVVILVQCAVEPDWDYAFHNARHLLAAGPEVKSFDPFLEKGQCLGFRLLANPTRKIDTKTRADGRRRHGKRVPVPADRLYDWLARRSEAAGFSLARDSVVVNPGYVYINKEGQGKRLRSARYDGMLTVDDPKRLQAALIGGIGPAKAFGFGLLSLARLLMLGPEGA